MAPNQPYPVAGTVYGKDGITPVSGATVNVIYQGDKLSTITNSSGQYLVDLANLPSGNTYANGTRFRIESYSTNLYTSATAVIDVAWGSTDLNIVLEPANIANMFSLSQKVVYNILNADTMIQYFGANLKDQIPPDLSRSSGFPYIIVNSPTITEDKLTLGPNRRFSDTIMVEVEIYSKIQKQVREVADAVHNAMLTNQTVSKGAYLYWVRVARSGLSHSFYTGEETYPIWTMSMVIEFTWKGL